MKLAEESEAGPNMNPGLLEGNWRSRFLNDAFVRDHFAKSGCSGGSISHVQIAKYDKANRTLHFVSAATSVQEARMGFDAFIPDDVKKGFRREKEKKLQLLEVLNKY